MRVAVLSLTRDRLDYTQTCFQSLRDNAGCDFDHYVLDNASKDDTDLWLEEQRDAGLIQHVVISPENIGISRGLNRLLDIANPSYYDVIAHFDNDCLVTQPDTLKQLAELVNEGFILSPRVLGLDNPPQPNYPFEVNGRRILDMPQIGGIFLTAPAWVYDEFRYSETNPLWGLDDVEICLWFQKRGGHVGYVEDLECWHYETTRGQRERFPDYFDRKDREFAGHGVRLG